MTATKNWQCHRCNREIKPGELFDIVDGEFLCEDCATTPDDIEDERHKVRSGLI